MTHRKNKGNLISQKKYGVSQTIVTTFYIKIFMETRLTNLLQPITFSRELVKRFFKTCYNIKRINVLTDGLMNYILRECFHDVEVMVFENDKLYQ